MIKSSTSLTLERNTFHNIRFISHEKLHYALQTSLKIHHSKQEKPKEDLSRGMAAQHHLLQVMHV